ncbi:tmRNA-binding protein SmpB [hydrothermal vent metagenome]|uniref:TmRNA-binding protein SmpB n=1 Tax=hydrothermal vent metagenome TaxID=652676 RepID=A0A3B1DWS6_9ZZZZ
MGKAVATNKKAYRDFFLTDSCECGIELKGGEVKSVRAGKVNFKDTFARVDKGQVYLYNLHIDPYVQASYLNEEADRPRRILLHKKEIKKLTVAVDIKKLTLVPTKIYFNARGYVKVELALGKGKKLYDKREDIKKRDVNRDIGRAMRGR